jgi:hypothetical protein
VPDSIDEGAGGERADDVTYGAEAPSVSRWCAGSSLTPSGPTRPDLTMDASEPSPLARRAFSAALALYGAYSLARLGEGSLLDSVDLAIHETGHLVFGPFGEVAGFAGGTIMQLLMPALFVGYFVRRGDQHAASVALWWVGQNCANVSVYAADARAQELPLVGGGEHDWFYLLSHFGWLENDQGVGRAFHVLAVLLMFGAVVWGFVTATSGSALERAVPQH